MINIISAYDLTTNDIIELVEWTRKISSKPISNILDGKIVALAFFQPSTRTRLGCETAIKRLGGQCIQLGDNSSMLKGEDFEDTIKDLEYYSDCIVIRHPEEGSAKRAAELVSIPVVNGGDGRNELPMGGLLLFYQIYSYAKQYGRELDDISVLFYGPLKYSRACHSLMPVLAKFDITMFSDCPKGTELPKKQMEMIKSESAELQQVRTEKVLSEMDVFIACGVEAHRESYSQSELSEVLNFYKPITKAFFKNMKQDSLIMGIPPRAWEISKEVDADPRQVYTRVPLDGLHTKMAIFATLLGKSNNQVQTL